LGVVVLTNSVLFGYPTALAYRVFDAYLGREPRDWSAELKRNLVRANGEASRSRDTGARTAGAPPTLALDRYAGRYEHPMYGDAVGSSSGDSLTLSLLGRRAAMSPWQKDTFRIAWPPAESMLRGMVPVAAFTVDGGVQPRSVRLSLAGEFVRGSSSSSL